MRSELCGGGSDVCGGGASHMTFGTPNPDEEGDINLKGAFSHLSMAVLPGTSSDKAGQATIAGAPPPPPSPRFVPPGVLLAQRSSRTAAGCLAAPRWCSAPAGQIAERRGGMPGARPPHADDGSEALTATSAQGRLPALVHPPHPAGPLPATPRPHPPTPSSPCLAHMSAFSACSPYCRTHACRSSCRTALAACHPRQYACGHNRIPHHQAKRLRQAGTQAAASSSSVHARTSRCPQGRSSSSKTLEEVDGLGGSGQSGSSRAIGRPPCAHRA